MSILVTGGAGFIGSFVTRSLLKRGEEIVVLDANVDNSPLSKILGRDEIERLALVRGDVADSVALFRLVREHRVDRIVHLAMFSSLRGESSPWEGVRVNVQGTLNCFEAALLFGIDRVVWASSVQVFGRHTPYSKEFGGPLRDDGPHRPWNVYSACKSLCDYMGNHYHRKFDLDVRGLRPCGTFGPARMPGLTTYISDMLRAVAYGEPYTIPDGEAALPHAYVEDSARAFVVALYHEGPGLSGRSLNVGGHPTTHRQMAEIARKVVPEARITVLEGDGGEPVTLPIDNSGLSRATGFQLEYSLEDGVRATIDFYRRQQSGATDSCMDSYTAG